MTSNLIPNESFRPAEPLDIPLWSLRKISCRKNGPVFRKQIEGTQFKERWSKNVMIFIYTDLHKVWWLWPICVTTSYSFVSDRLPFIQQKRGETDGAGSSVKSGRWTWGFSFILNFWILEYFFWVSVAPSFETNVTSSLVTLKKTPFFFSSYLVLGFFPLGAYVVGVRKRCVRKRLGYLVIHKKQAGIPTLRNTFELVYWILLAILAKACKSYNI